MTAFALTSTSFDNSTHFLKNTRTHTQTHTRACATPLPFTFHCLQAAMMFDCAVCGKLHDEPSFSELFVQDVRHCGLCVCARVCVCVCLCVCVCVCACVRMCRVLLGHERTFNRCTTRSPMLHAAECFLVSESQEEKTFAVIDVAIQYLTDDDLVRTRHVLRACVCVYVQVCVAMCACLCGYVCLCLPLLPLWLPVVVCTSRRKLHTDNRLFSPHSHTRARMCVCAQELSRLAHEAVSVCAALRDVCAHRFCCGRQGYGMEGGGRNADGGEGRDAVACRLLCISHQNFPAEHLRSQFDLYRLVYVRVRLCLVLCPVAVLFRMRWRMWLADTLLWLIPWSARCTDRERERE